MDLSVIWLCSAVFLLGSPESSRTLELGQSRHVDLNLKEFDSKAFSLLPRKSDLPVKVGLFMADATFTWAAVKRVRIPKEWTKQSFPAWKHDYALIVLRRRHRRRFMMPYAWNHNLADQHYFIHFSAFDFTSDRVQLKYRFCMALNDTGEVLHSQCDVSAMGSGAGVYIRPYDPLRMTWSRILIGIQTRECLGCSKGDSYTTVRKITPQIAQQLCEWTKRTRYSLCY